MIAGSNGGNHYQGASDMLISLPTWARVIAFLGFPTAVATILLAALLGWIRTPMSDIVIFQQEQINLLRAHIEYSASAKREDAALTDYQNMLLRTLCRNLVAKQDLLQCEPRYRGYEEPPKP